MVFEFLKKKLQSAVQPAAGAQPAATPGGEYEARRREAEELHAAGKSSEAIARLETLAADLAGAGNFPLAVAVRHQIHQWRPERSDVETPTRDGIKMATQRAQSGIFRIPLVTPAPAAEAAVEAVVEPKPAAPPPTSLAGLSPLLDELNAEEIAGLIESTGLVGHPAGNAVVEEGMPGDHLYIVTRGVLSVTTNGAGGTVVKVGSLAVGDFFGEVALVTGKPRAATVTAETDAECLQISSENWGNLASKHPRLWQLLEEAISVRAERTAEAVVDDLRRRRGGDAPS